MRAVVGVRSGLGSDGKVLWFIFVIILATRCVVSCGLTWDSRLRVKLMECASLPRYYRGRK